MAEQFNLLAPPPRPVVKPLSKASRSEVSKAPKVADSSTYGRCKCGQPFQIPGLDHSLCPQCGWVETPKG